MYMPNCSAATGIWFIAMPAIYRARPGADPVSQNMTPAQESPVPYFHECCFPGVHFEARIMNDGHM
jgi:hypothetical protein